VYDEAAFGRLRVLAGAYSAQYGGAPGGLAARLSPEGGTRLHGSAFAFARPSALAATNPFSIATHYRDGVVTAAAVRPAGELTTLGFAIGFPLGLPLQWLKPRAAAPPASAHTATLFAALQAQLRDDSIVSTPAVAGFYALSPSQIALLGNRGVTTAQTETALDFLDSLSGTTARHATRIVALARADVPVGPRDALAIAYAGNRLHAPAGATLGQASEAVVALGTGSLGDAFAQVDAVAVRWRHSLSPRWSNELAAQLARDLEYETPHAPLAQEPAIGPGGFAPQVSIAPNGFAYGTPAALASVAGGGGRSAYPDEWRVELAEDMRARVGRNLLAMGGDWSRVHDRIAALSAGEGAFLYDSGVTGGKLGGLVDWITDEVFNANAYPNGGCPSINAAVHDFCFRSFTQSFATGTGSQQTEFVLHELAAFAEDSVRAGDRLTVTFGARWEYTLLPLPQAPNAVLDQDIAGLGASAAGGVSTNASESASTASYPEDRNNFGPRVGLAWSPGRAGWLVVHAGYGYFFGHLPGATLRAALVDTALASTALASATNGASTLHVRITPTTITQCPQVTTNNQGFGYPCDFLAAPPAAVAQTTSATMFAAGFRLPAVQRASLSVQGALGRHLLLRVGYTMALARQLPSSVDRNISPSTAQVTYVLQGGDGHPGLYTGATFAVPLYTARPIAQYGPVTTLVSDANATFHAGELEARWHGHAGAAGELELRGGYSFSRAIDDDPQSGATPRLNGRFDPMRNGYDKGLSDQQVAQRLVIALALAPHVDAGPGPLRAALRGWRLTALGTASSGRPYSYQVFGGTRLPGGHESLNGSGGATYLPSVGRNTLRLPARGSADLRVVREFAAGGRARVGVFAEAFNLTNTQSLTRVQTRAFLLGTPATPGAPTPLIFQDAATVAAEGLLSTPAFGAPESSTNGAGRERQVELGARLRF